MLYLSILGLIDAFSSLGGTSTNLDAFVSGGLMLIWMIAATWGLIAFWNWLDNINNQTRSSKNEIIFRLIGLVLGATAAVPAVFFLRGDLGLPTILGVISIAGIAAAGFAGYDSCTTYKNASRNRDDG